MNKIIPAAILAAGLSVWWCSTEIIEKKDPIIQDTNQKCSKILFWLWEYCVTSSEVKWILLSWNSYYSIAKKSWDQSDTWVLRSSDIKQNTNVLLQEIQHVAEIQKDEKIFSTDVNVSVTWVSLSWNATWYSSVVWNMQKWEYIHGFWVLDSSNSNANMEENKINAMSRCKDTILNLLSDISVTSDNNVVCNWEVIPFSSEELNTLLSVWGWLLEYIPELRNNNISPAIIAFWYIKWIESWKIKNDISDPIFLEKFQKAISIVQSKHYVNIDWIKVDIYLKIEENKISNLSKWILWWIVGLPILWFLFWKLRKNKKN